MIAIFIVYIFVFILVKPSIDTMSLSNQMCQSAYGDCRKYQDIASPAISVCNQNTTLLTSKLKSLLENQVSVKEAQGAIQSKAIEAQASRVRQNVQRVKCEEAIALAETMIGTIQDNPASQLLSQLANNVTNNTRAADCTVEDVPALFKLDADIDATEIFIDYELGDVQYSFQGKLYTIAL
jgi:hypothetical protein